MRRRISERSHFQHLLRVKKVPPEFHVGFDSLLLVYSATAMNSYQVQAKKKIKIKIKVLK